MNRTNGPADSLDRLNIFISYRRDDASWPAGALYRELAGRFGAEHVFYDIDSIPPGADWQAHIADMLATVHVALILIGSQWLASAHANGLRRLDDPNDALRFELEIILARGIHMIPVLLDSASLPSAEELPTSISALPARNAMKLRSEPDFMADINRIVVFLKHYEGSALRSISSPVPTQTSSPTIDDPRPTSDTEPDPLHTVSRRPGLAPPPSQRWGGRPSRSLVPFLAGNHPAPSEPGWHPDPTGRYASRYWEGGWTVKVRGSRWSAPITDEVAPPAVTEAVEDPGWWTDPTRQHLMRYFDGVDWTNRVSDDGYEFIDVDSL